MYLARLFLFVLSVSFFPRHRVWHDGSLASASWACLCLQFSGIALSILLSIVFPRQTVSHDSSSFLCFPTVWVQLILFETCLVERMRQASVG
jgi:hypothetical protein